MTLRLTNTPEAEAIGLVLRTAAGYVAAPRRAGNPGSSRYDRVTILATRTAPGGIRTPVQVPARNAAADAMGPGAAASPGLLPMEDLQRLLDATSERPASPPPRPAGRDIPVLTTPFPGVGAVGDPP